MKGEILRTSTFIIGGLYSRKDISREGGVREPVGSRDPHWSSGIVVFENAIALLVTLKKETYSYRDSFDADQFWWQSQSQQTQASPVLESLMSGTKPALLFVRVNAKMRGGTAAPFVYCGRLSIPVAEGMKPVTCLFDVLEYQLEATGPLREVYDWRIDAPLAPTEVQRRDLAVLARANRTRFGQGRLLNSEERKTVEQHAMKLATKHYEENGFFVTDTSRTQSYDLLCEKASEARRVEVKGSLTMAHFVTLTAGEVRAARSASEIGLRTDLFIVHSIVLDRTTTPSTTTGGVVKKLTNWVPENDHLTPTEFRYAVPMKSNDDRTG
jgi:hypothetical protein